MKSKTDTPTTEVEHAQRVMRRVARLMATIKDDNRRKRAWEFLHGEFLVEQKELPLAEK